MAKVPGTKEEQVAPKTDQSVALQTADPGWEALYIAGAVAALVAVTLFRRNFSVELMQFRGFGIIRLGQNVLPEAAYLAS